MELGEFLHLLMQAVRQPHLIIIIIIISDPLIMALIKTLNSTDFLVLYVYA